MQTPCEVQDFGAVQRSLLAKGCTGFPLRTRDFSCRDCFLQCAILWNFLGLLWTVFPILSVGYPGKTVLQAQRVIFVWMWLKWPASFSTSKNVKMVEDGVIFGVCFIWMFQHFNIVDSCSYSAISSPCVQALSMKYSCGTIAITYFQ